jgi:hypothetical protein
MGKASFAHRSPFQALLALLSAGMLASSAHAFFFPKQINGGPGKGQNPVVTPHSPPPLLHPPPSPPSGPGPSPGGSGSAPEPATLISGAVGAGLVGLFLIRRRHVHSR